MVDLCPLIIGKADGGKLAHGRKTAEPVWTGVCDSWSGEEGGMLLVVRRETPAAILIVVAELKARRYISAEAVGAAEIKLQIGSA